MRWVKIHDGLLEWGWHTRPEMVSLFIHLIILANTKDREFEGRTIRRGQLLTSLRSLSEKTGITIQSLRTSLANLEKTGEVTRESTQQGTLITVCKYADYQDADALANTPTNTQLTHDQHTTNTPVREKSTHQLTQQEPAISSYRKGSCESVGIKGNTSTNTQLTHQSTQTLDNNNNNNNNLNLKNSCCCLDSNTLADADAREGFSFRSLPEEQQQSEQQGFYETFYFGNFRNVTAEVKRFIATNEAHLWLNKGKTECYATPEQRRAIAQLWRPAPGSRPRVPSAAFLAMWKDLYALAKKSDPDVAKLMLDERVSVGETADGRMFVALHQEVWDWFTDQSRATQTRKIIDRFTKKKIHPKIIY